MRKFKEYTEYLFNLAPLFQNIGNGAYKEGLSNTYMLDERFGYPHTSYKTIHIAGTNGKGSCSHSIASILQESGLKVGLYTSPHLVSFTERIRVNGKPIVEDYVMDFIDENKTFLEEIKPSFFEVATALAFKYFKDEKVDVAIIEVGLGGRLDCTNIIHPELSIITNISKDHVQFLGDTLEAIAGEKAGIMKPDVTCVIGEVTDETLPVFEKKAKETGNHIVYCHQGDNSYFDVFELKGSYQKKNINTITTAINELRRQGWQISDKDLTDGLSHVSRNTGLRGRWETLSHAPLTICDTGHNTGGFSYISEQISNQECRTRRIVIGMVNDKDVSGVLAMLPKKAVYYFCQASVSRALDAESLQEKASKFGLVGTCYTTVNDAVEQARRDSSPDDFIFIGGSTFVVADLLSKT